MNSVKWSLVIGAYNQGKYIPFIFEAINRFKEKDLEAIYCDDGSDDNTKEEIAKRKNENLTYIWQPKEGFKLAKNVNNGFKKARGERIVCFMGDSIPDVHLLEEYDKVYEKERILTGVRYNVKTPEGLELIDKDWRMDEAYFDIDMSYTPWRRFTGNNWCASRELVEKVGYWNESFEGYGLEDFEFVLRGYKTGYRFTPVPNAIVYHVSHPKRGENESNQLKWLEIEKDFLIKSGLAKEDETNS